MYTSARKWEEVGKNSPRAEVIEKSHIPVLSREVLFWLKCQPGRRYLDCTVGQGGLAALMLEATAPDGVVIGLDRDSDAIVACQGHWAHFGPRLVLVHGSYAALKTHVHATGMRTVHGVIFDLGISSAQLDDPARGFSFQAEGPLDMRMDRSSGRTAADLIAESSERELADLIYRYGEERFARRIARAIVRARATRPLRSTRELVAAVTQAVPASYRHGRIHCATRTFQAMRIAVNDELSIIDRAIRDAAEVLEPGGRLCVIAFHSLEDRIVKHTLRALSQQDGAVLRVLTKKPQEPTDTERRENPRARSAKLRVAERLPIRRAA